MTRRIASLLAYFTSLAVMAAMMPWGARDRATFESKAMTAVIVSVIVFFSIRIATAAATHSHRNDGRAAAKAEIQIARLRIGMWSSVKLCCAISLAIGLGCIVLARGQLLGLQHAFFISVVAQQLPFITAEIALAQKRADSRYLQRAVGLLVLVLMACFFAGTSNIFFLAQQPPAAPHFADSTNLLFALPTIAVGLVVFVKGMNLRS